MIAATATFAVLKRHRSIDSLQVVAILINLADIRAHHPSEPPWPTYAQAVDIAAERARVGQERIGLLRRFGMAPFVTVHQRIVFDSAEELDALVAAMA